jgi:CO dehydrogenase/acetyl-CoA synthase beta subunit
MNLFENSIDELRNYIQKERSVEKREYIMAQSASWPRGDKGNIVLGPDTAFELGNPKDESSSFILWSGDGKNIKNNCMTLIGPDLTDAKQKNLPFGKVLLFGLKGMTEENCYERHRALELVRYDLNMSGYMMRAVSQYGREWSRLSREAMDKGFDFKILCNAIAELYRKIDFVESIEILIVTSSPDAVRELGELGNKASRLIDALNKMSTEMSFDCGTCDFVDVCSEVEDLRTIRNNMIKEGTNVSK